MTMDKSELEETLEDQDEQIAVLRARSKRLEAERDALVEKLARLTSLIIDVDDCESGSEEEHDLVSEIFQVLDTEPSDCLARLIAEKQIEAFDEVAGWLDPKSEAFGGPSHQEAELIGMEISGPTQCSSATACHRAGYRAFKEAARIFSVRQQAEGGSDE